MIAKEPKKVKDKIKLLLWSLAILVVISALIIIHLFFNTFSVPALATGCIENSGFICKAPVYNHFTGNIVVTLGQNTHISWLTANFVFIPEETSTLNESPYLLFTSNPVNTTYGSTTSNDLKSGQLVSITLPITGKVNIGTYANGVIWAQYTTNLDSNLQYARLGSVSIGAS